jgi:hypothetical protein
MNTKALINKGNGEAPSGFEPLNKGFADGSTTPINAIVPPEEPQKSAVDPSLIQQGGVPTAIFDERTIPGERAT